MNNKSLPHIYEGNALETLPAHSKTLVLIVRSFNLGAVGLASVSAPIYDFLIIAMIAIIPVACICKKHWPPRR